jgi:hypothetical protein
MTVARASFILGLTCALALIAACTEDVTFSTCDVPDPAHTAPDGGPDPCFCAGPAACPCASTAEGAAAYQRCLAALDAGASE